MIDNDITIDEATVFQQAIRYYIENIVSQIKSNKSFVINDDVQLYMIYIFSMSTYLKQLLNKIIFNGNKNNIGDIQFDIVFIAKNTINIFNGNIFNNKINSFNGNIEQNLNNHLYVKHIILNEYINDRQHINGSDIMFCSIFMK